MTKYLASDLLLDQLTAEGARYLFGKPGPDSAGLYRSVYARSDLHNVVALDDGAAVFMAMGYAQASGRTGVVIVSGMEGLAGALSGLLSARRTRVPLVVLAGQPDNAQASDTEPPRNDVRSVAHPFCKSSVELRNGEEAARLLRRAFHESTSPPWGPVIIAVPADVAAAEVKRQTIMPPQQSPPGCADSGFMKRVTQLLVTSAKPAIIVGQEVAQYRAAKEVASLAEVLGSPVYSETLPPGLNFPSQHPLFAGVLTEQVDSAQQMFEGCDVVLALGTRNALSGRQAIPTSAVVVHIGVDPLFASRGIPAHLCASANLQDTLARLRADIQLQVDNQWISRARGRLKMYSSSLEVHRLAAREEMAEALAGSPIAVAELFRLLDEKRGAKSVVVNDAGTLAPLVLELMSFEHGGSYCASADSAPGYGVPAGAGVQWANPEYRVIVISDEIGLLKHPQTLWTLSHYGLPLKVVVLNSQHYGPAGDSSGKQKGKLLEIAHPPVSFLDLAGSMGVPANSVWNPAELEDAVSEMLEMDGPYVLDVRTAYGSTET